MSLRLNYLYIAVFLVFNSIAGYSQCTGLSADAGPDLFTCDPSMPVQLMGSYSGNPMKYSWTPTTYLSDPNATDPIVNAPPGKYKYTFTVEQVGTTNLIRNGDFEAGNSGFTHEYSYGSPGGTFGPGWLSVGPDPFPYNGGFSHCPDHTTGSGNMLIVDGHTSTNAKVWCQNVNVTNGSTYLFKLYVTSVYPVSPAVLNVEANGVSIGTVTAGALCDWIELEACFKATSGTVEMCIRETTGVGFGNDFAIDDIEMYEKCMDDDEVMVEVVDLKARIEVPKLPKCASDIFDLNAIGSTASPNITYEWKTVGGKIVSQNGLTARGQGSGTYIIKVTYKNGNVICEKEAEIDVTASDDLEGTLEVEGIANCNSDTIILKANPLNGSGQFTFNWIPANKIHRGRNDSIAYVTEAGIYKVVIIDANSGCELEIQDVVVSDTLHPNLKLTGDTLLNCIRNNALLTGTPFDTSKYTYEWVLPDNSKLRNEDSLVTSIEGNYQLRITDKTNKCFTDKSIAVKKDTLIPDLELGPDLILDCIQSSLSIVPNGNNPNQIIDYLWKLPSGNLPAESMLNSKTETKAGKVVLTAVNKINGCTRTDSLLIVDSRKLPAVKAGNGGTLSCTTLQLQLNGNGTKIDSTNYFWTTTNGNIVSGSNTLTPIVNAPGWYYIQVIDTTNHCSNLDSIFIDENKVVPNAQLGPGLNFTCSDTLIAIDGGLSSNGNQLTYQWFTFNGTIGSGQGSNKLFVRSAGDYSLIVRDTVNGCADTAMINVKPDLNAPFASIAFPDTLSCKKNSINLVGTANSPVGNQIQFNWIANQGQPIQNASSLNPGITQAGDYSLSVKDLVNGCSTLVIITVLIDTIPPQINAGQDLIWNCSTTQFNLQASSPTTTHSLQYNWSTVDGMLIGPANSAATVAGRPGTYFVSNTDLVNGCQSVDQLTISADTAKPIAMISSLDTLTCIKRLLNINGQGSSTGNRFNYQWTHANGNIVGPVNGLNIQLDKAGLYILRVIDTLNHCEDSTQVTIFEDIQKPLIDAGANAQLNCSTLDLTLNGQIINPKGTELIVWNSPQGNFISPTNALQVKINKPGTYYIQVTNPANGCVNTDSLLVSQINNLQVRASGQFELTCTVKDGILVGAVQNGSGTENLNWTTNQGNIVGSNTLLTAKVDRPGVYYFRVQNPANGCAGLDSVVVTENTNVPTAIDFNVDQPKCPGDGWNLNLNLITGGEKPLRYFLDNQEFFNSQYSGTVSGNHQIRVLDKNGCELLSSFNIIQPAGLNVQLIPLVKLQSGEDYTIQPTYSIPKDSIASFEWSPADYLSCTNCESPKVIHLDKEIEYLLTITNNNGCTATARIRLEVVKRNIWFPNAISPNGDNINDSFYPVVTEDSYNEIKSMQIFDRWGNRLYEAVHFPPNDPSYGWKARVDGDVVIPGVYVYLLELEWKNGEIQKFYGDLNVIR